MKEFEYKGYKLKEGVVYFDNDSEFVLFKEGNGGRILFWFLDSTWDSVSLDSATYFETVFDEEYLNRLYEVTGDGFKPVEKVWEPEAGKVYLFSDYSLEESISNGGHTISKLSRKHDGEFCWVCANGSAYKNIYKVPAELLGE